jgi:hypothetical protein
MSRSVEVLAKIFSAVVKSLFFSGVMFIIFFSIVTGGFPPDFRKISRAFGGVQELNKMSHQPSMKAVAPSEISPAGFDDEKDVADLEAYNRKRAKLGEDLFGPGSGSQDEEEGRILPMRQISSIDPNEELKNQMRDLQQEIFRLQQRVNELEEQAATKKPKR